MMFVDRRTALVALDPATPAAGALVVHTPGLVDLVVTLFDLLWEQSAALAPERQECVEDFTDLEVTVVRLLAQGLKDEAVSRRTGLSLRSVRRTVASVGERLGTQSRFELGVKCRDLGLL
jgi:DNA-binding NarL/FixJ family response regulator